MTKIEEINELFIELIYNVDIESKSFNERALQIIDEISDFAEQTDIYKLSKEQGEEFYTEVSSAWLFYVHLLDRIVNAPFSFLRNSSILILMPFLRKKLREEAYLKE